MLQIKEGDKIEILHLTGGELIEFNSKVMHKGTPLDSDRIGIGLWQDRIDIKNPDNWLKE